MPDYCAVRNDNCMERIKGEPVISAIRTKLVQLAKPVRRGACCGDDDMPEDMRPEDVIAYEKSSDGQKHVCEVCRLKVMFSLNS